MKRGAQVALQCRTHVLQHGHVCKDGRDLKRSNDAAPGGLRGLLSRDVGAVKGDAALGGLQEFGQQVEESGFTRAVGANQRMDVATLNVKVNLVDSHETLELFGQATRFKNDFS